MTRKLTKVDYAFPPSARLDRDTNGYAFFFEDDRRFLDVLADWMLSEGFAPGVSGGEIFLERVGLAGFLGNREWARLLTGEAAPGVRLSLALAAILPSGAFGTGRDKVIGRLSFLNKARTQRDRTPPDQWVELSQDQYVGLRVRLATMLFSTGGQVGAESSGDPGKEWLVRGPPDPGLDEITRRLVEVVSARHPETPEDLLLERMTESYATHPREFVTILVAILMGSGLEDRVERWAEVMLSVPDGPETGQSSGACRLLAFHRQYAGLTQKEFADRMGVSEMTARRWESGSLPLRCGSLTPIVINKVLRLTSDECDQLMRSLFPTLEPRWLDNQDPSLWAGLLLATYRRRAGLNQEELSATLGVSRQTLSYWESGHHPITPEKLLAIPAALGLTADESNRLARARWPALDPQWLSAQEPHRQSGMMLAAFRERACLDQAQAASRLLISKGTVYCWEAGRRSVATDKLGKISETFGLSPTERSRFETVCRVSSRPVTGADEPQSGRAAHFGERFSSHDTPRGLQHDSTDGPTDISR
jgi:transcriptional regulator with XRE-family HTH domain